jgi:hypothetical protein
MSGGANIDREAGASAQWRSSASVTEGRARGCLFEPVGDATTVELILNARLPSR